MVSDAEQAERLYDLGAKSGRDAERNEIMAFISSKRAKIEYADTLDEWFAGLAAAYDEIYDDLRDGKHR